MKGMLFKISQKYEYVAAIQCVEGVVNRRITQRNMPDSASII